MTDLHVGGRPRSRWLRAGLAAVVITGAIAGGFAAGRYGQNSEPSPTTTSAPAPPWQGGDSASAPINVGGASSLPTLPAANLTRVGVPFGWPESDDGAVAAAVVAVKAGMWFKYVLADPWGELGFLAAADGQTDERKGRVTAFLTVAPATRADGAPTPVSGGPCGCGVAVLAASLPAEQVASDQGFRTVTVTATTFTTGKAGVRAVVSVTQVLLHWEGDWKLADAQVSPTAAATDLPAGAALPVPTWGA